MVIKRSPFVKKQSIDYGYGVDSDGNTTYTDANGVTTIVNKTTKGDGKSTLGQEQNKLTKAVAKAAKLSKLLPMGNSAGIVDSLKDLAKTGRTPKSVGGGVLRGLGSTLTYAAGEGVMDVIKSDPLEPVRRTALSGALELQEGIVTGVRAVTGGDIQNDRVTVDGKTRNIDASWQDFVANAKDPKYNYAKETGYTGKKAAVVNFVANTVVDPLTYVTLPASQASKAAKIALSVKMGLLTKKYPELLPVMDDIARYGAPAIPAHIRKAENIFVGIKYMGFEVPNTSAMAQAWRYSFGDAGQRVGDFLYRHPSTLKLSSGFTRGSIKKLSEQGIGRGLVTGTEWMEKYLGGLGVYSASNYGRGAKGMYAATHLGKGQEILQKANEIPDERLDEVSKIIERRSSGATSSDETVQAVADGFRVWDDEAYAEVDAARQVFGKKWGVVVNKLGWVEDHLFHTMTDDARTWMRTKGAASGWFDNFQYNAWDIEAGNGISSFRRLKDAYVDDKGVLVAEKFLGEDVIKGDIASINEISNRIIGMDWFKKDIRSIMESSVQSYARMMERVAFYDRMMDFGPTVAKGLVKYVIPDEALVGSIDIGIAGLMKAEAKLLGRIKRGIPTLAASREGVGAELQTASELAVNVLAGKMSRKVAVDDEISTVIREIDMVVEQLRVAGELAATKTADGRGEFNDVWSSLIRETEQFRESLVNGTSERFITLKELRREYLTLYPTSNDMQGKSAEWLAERIVRATGGADAIDAREAARVQTQQFLQQQRDAMPAADVDTIRLIDDQIRANDVELEAIRRLNDVKKSADYAGDGLIYGFVPDTGAGAAGAEPAPFQLFTTKPVDNEFGTFAQMDDAVAGHAIPSEDLLDLRKPETFMQMLNPEYWADDLNRAWNEVGLGAYLDEADVAKMIENKGVLDPQFINVYPEKAELLSGLYDMHIRVKNSVNAGDVENIDTGELAQFFNWFADMQQRIAYSISPDNSDIVGSTVTQWWYKNLVDSSKEYGFKGALIPATNIFGDNFTMGGEWAVLMPADAKVMTVGGQITDPWQLVKDNDFIKNSLDDVMESAHLSALDKTDLLRQAGVDIKRTLKEQTIYDKAIAEQSVQQSETKALEALRNADNVVVNGVEVPRKEVVAKIAEADEFLQTGYNNIDREIKQEIEAQFGVEELQNTQRLLYDERLPMLLDEATVLKNWSDGTAAGLTQEIMDMILLIQRKPIKGSTGASNAAWVNQVEQVMKTSLLIDDPNVKAAYDRVTTLLHADEVALSKVSEEINQNIIWSNMAKAGIMGGKVMNTAAEKGWKEIEGLGIQMPREVLEVWGPNIKKLENAAEWSKYTRALDAVNAYWKRYVTASVGFITRNGFSATFMNYADGVTNSATLTGLKWAGYQVESIRGVKSGKNFSNWIDRAGLTDPAEIAKAEWATRVVMATGHGVTDDFAIPVGKRARYVTDNRYLRFYSRKNMAVERAVRLPMAIDSFEKGLTFDEAVARINRIHFDYSDLSKMDQRMKRVVPFWIWTSRNVPLQFTQIATRPKAYYEYERLKKEFPVNPDLIVPKWIQDRDPWGIGQNMLLTPDLPQVRLMQQLKSVATPMGIVGMATPIVKTPLELMAGKQLGIDVGTFEQSGDQQTGVVEKPIAKFMEWAFGNKLVSYDKEGNLMMDPRVAHVIEQAFPPMAQINRLTGGFTGGKDTLNERMKSSWYNWFGIPLREVKESQMRSEVIRRRYVAGDVTEDIQDQLDKLKGKKP